MVAHGFKRENVPLEYLKQKRSKPKRTTDILEPVDLDWAFVYSHNDLEDITKTILIFCMEVSTTMYFPKIYKCTFQKYIDILPCQHNF